MKRRNFIKHTGTALSIPLFFPGIELAAVPRSSLFNALDPYNDRVLVLIQLNGGNDGLNTVLPLDQYSRLAAVRPNILIPEQNAIKLTEATGLHPGLQGFRQLFEEGHLGLVHSVGYPDQNRSHFRSMDIWQSASPATEQWRTGWLGRYFEQDHSDFPEGYPNETNPHPFAITMGSVVSETCQGQVSNFSLTLDDPFSLSPLSESEGHVVSDSPYGQELAFLRTTIAQTNAYSSEISVAAEKGSNTVEYPDSNLGRQLKNIALLIGGGLQTKVYIAQIGGFDTHANQVEDGSTTIGTHAELLQNLGDAVAAFQQDLKGLGLEERVVGMTFSEFGRQIRSNFSFGTDHGTAAPLFIFGSCVNPSILGNNPEIPEEVQVQEGVPMQFDFRNIYGSILKDWFELPESDIKSILYPEFQYIPVIKDCQIATDTEEVTLNELQLNNFPNPFRAHTTIQFDSRGGHVHLAIFDARGALLTTLVNKKLPAGMHQIEWVARDLPAGNYYYRIQEGAYQKTKRMIKL